MGELLGRIVGHLVQVAALAELLVGFAVFAGHAILGVVILGVGLWLANLAAEVIRANRAGARAILSTVTRVAIIGLAATMALREVGLAEDIINRAFTLLVGAVAVAGALAFGLGARETAGRQVERWMQAYRGGNGRAEN